MATSMKVIDLFEEAILRGGIPTSRLTPEITMSLKRNLYLLLTSYSNQGLTTWCIEKNLYGLYPGQIIYPMADGTLDVLQAALRRPLRTVATASVIGGGNTAFLQDGDVDTICQQTNPAGHITLDFGGETQTALLGLLSGVTAVQSFTIEKSNDGITWTLVQAIEYYEMVDGQWLWLALEPTPIARFVRLVASADTTFSFRELYTANQYTDVTMARLNQDDYFALSDKNFQSQQVLQYWLDRPLEGPRMRVWPSPNDTFECMTIWTKRHITDVGDLSDELEVPPRVIDAITWQLSERALLIIPNVDMSRMSEVKSMVEMTTKLALGEDRDRAPVVLIPRIAPYTR